MRDFWNSIQLMWSLVGAWVGLFVGGFDGFFYALVIFVICDYITGVLAAGVNHELSSEIGFKGIAKKITIFIIVGIAHVIDHQIIREGSILRTAIIFFYVSNEGLSIVENATAIGLPVPEKLKDILKQIKEDDKGDTHGAV